MKIHSTKDYSQFKKITGNRALNYFHIEALAKSISERNLLHLQPMVVNEQMEVIDGQHRLEAAKRLNVDIYYGIYPNLTIEDMRILNINNTNWTLYDYMESYIELGYEAYINFAKFLKTNKHSISVNFHLIYVDKRASDTDSWRVAFKEGKLVNGNYERAAEILQQLQEVEQHLSFKLRRSSAIALIRLLKNPLYDHASFVRRLESAGDDVRVQPSVNRMYKEFLLTYNHKRTVGAIW